MTSTHLRSQRPSWQPTTAHWQHRQPSWKIKSPYREEKYSELNSEEFNQALNSYVLCECTQDGLDADDVAYLERFVRHSMLWSPYGREAAQEAEQTFWGAPYGVEPGVTRRIGAVTTIPAELRKAYQEARLARRHEALAKRAELDAEAAAELAREQAAWDIEQQRLAEERERRLKQAAQADQEWEETGQKQRERVLRDMVGRRPQKHWPIRRNGRFYVPQWKIEEEHQQERAARKTERDARALALRNKRRERREQCARQKLERQEQQAAAKAEAERQAEAKQLEIQRKREQDAVAEAEAQKRLQLMRAQMQHEREQAEAEQRRLAAQKYERDACWSHIANLDGNDQMAFIASHPQVWPTPVPGQVAVYKNNYWVRENEVAMFVNARPQIYFRRQGFNGSVQWLTTV